MLYVSKISAIFAHGSARMTVINMDHIRNILFVICLCTCVGNSTAQKVLIQGIVYEILESDKVRVTAPGSYEERIQLYSGDLYIPDSVSINRKVYHVCDIADSFRGCVNLKTIRLPHSLESIISMAFAGCSSLRYIELPDNISCIYAEAFIGCKSLRYVKLPVNLRIIQESAFEGCTHLKRIDIDIPQQVCRIGDCAFCGCKGLRQIYVHAPMPPSFDTLFIDSDSTLSFFGEVRPSIPVHIPKGSKSCYQCAKEWSPFTNMIDDL